MMKTVNLRDKPIKEYRFISIRQLMLNVLLTASLFVPCAESQSSYAVQTVKTPPTLVDQAMLFQQAVANDLAGHNHEARMAYDALKNTDMAMQAAVPSAINFAALGQFDAASKAFEQLAASHDTRSSDYAKLWQLWLIARTHTGKPASLKKELARLASGMNLSSPGQQALVRLYAGSGSIDAAFAAVAAIPGINELQRRDALTETIFFTGGYLQYVARNNKAALQFYEREQNKLNNTSLESPLINAAITSLHADKH